MVLTSEGQNHLLPPPPTDGEGIMFWGCLLVWPSVCPCMHASEIPFTFNYLLNGDILTKLVTVYSLTNTDDSRQTAEIHRYFVYYTVVKMQHAKTINYSSSAMTERPCDACSSGSL